MPRVTRERASHAQAHLDGLVAVVGTALLQDVEPSRVVDVDTLLWRDVLGGWGQAGQQAGVLGRPPRQAAPVKGPQPHPWAGHFHRQWGCASRASRVSQPSFPTLTQGRNLAGQSGVSPQGLAQGMLTSFTLLGGHVLVFRAWQSTQEPWAGQGEEGRRVSHGLVMYLANPETVALSPGLRQESQHRGGDRGVGRGRSRQREEGEGLVVRELV